jgi:hypothetical protein
MESICRKDSWQVLGICGDKSRASEKRGDVLFYFSNFLKTGRSKNNQNAPIPITIQ